MLKYLGYPQALCDTFFGIFMVSWFVTRHVLFIVAIKTTIVDAPKLVNLHWDPETGHYLSRGSLNMFILCLVALQVSVYLSVCPPGILIFSKILQIMWFVTICGVAYKTVVGDGATDTRSDSEE